MEIKTNIEEVRKIPRVAGLLPGKYPGKVVRVKTGPIVPARAAAVAAGAASAAAAAGTDLSFQLTLFERKRTDAPGRGLRPFFVFGAICPQAFSVSIELAESSPLIGLSSRDRAMVRAFRLDGEKHPGPEIFTLP